MRKRKEEVVDSDNNNNTHNYNINTSIREEIRSLQKSIALLRKDLPKIIHDELVRSSKITKGQGF